MTQNGEPWFVKGRAEALAELFIEQLNADFLVRVSGAKIGDYHLQFLKAGSRLPRSLLIEVKGTNRKLSSRWPLIISRKIIELAVRQEPKFLLLVADVVNDQLHYVWGEAFRPTPETSFLLGDARILLPLKEVTTRTAKEIREKILK